MSGPYAAVWRSPGGRFHRRRVCSFNPNPGRTTTKAVTAEELADALEAGRVCICLRWNRPLFDINHEGASK